MLPSRLRPASAFCRAGADQVAFHAPAGRERSVSCLSARLFGLSSCCDGIVTLTLGGRRGTKATRCRADHEAWRAQFSCRQILNASVRAVRGCQSVPTRTKVAIDERVSGEETLGLIR